MRNFATAIIPAALICYLLTGCSFAVREDTTKSRVKVKTWTLDLFPAEEPQLVISEQPAKGERPEFARYIK